MSWGEVIEIACHGFAALRGNPCGGSLDVVRSLRASRVARSVQRANPWHAEPWHGGLLDLAFGSIPLRDREAAAGTKGKAGDFEADGGLFALELAEVDQPDDAGDYCGVEAGLLHDAHRVLALLDVAGENLVEHVVRRE